MGDRHDRDDRDDRDDTDDVDEVTQGVLAASRALVGVLARSLSVPLERMTLLQYRVLVLLSVRGSLRSGVLAAELGIHASTFSRLADRLVAGGWVRRADNPDSRREVMIELAEPGRALVTEVTAHRAQEIRAILQQMEGRQRRSVLRGLHLFAAAAGEVDAGELSRLGVEGES